MLSPYPDENAIREIGDVQLATAARAAALVHVTRTRPCINLVQTGADIIMTTTHNHRTINDDNFNDISFLSSRQCQLVV
jgi:hypothetical protein